jgi:glutamate-1-semialdehyde aminotransferase
MKGIYRFFKRAGPGILGHSNESTPGVKESNGYLYCLGSGVGQTAMMERWLRSLSSMFHAEKVRFSVAGTEAVQLADSACPCVYEKALFYPF